MAFLSKVGNILRQTVSRKINSGLGFTPIYHSIRCMSSAPSSKLFIGGLSFNTDEPSLNQEFGKYGEIVDARIIHDRETGRSRGFGFVTYSNVEEASSAIQALDGKELHGRQVRVDFANERPRTYGGGYNDAQYGGGGGGYGGGGGGSGFSGGYGNASHDGAGGGGTYGDGAAYGSGAAGGYDSGYNGGPAAGGNHPSGGNYGTNNYGGTSYVNNGSFGGAGGSENLENAGGFGGSDNFRNDRIVEAGAGNNFATGGYGSNLNHAGDDADSFEGTYGEDASEKGNFANRA